MKNYELASKELYEFEEALKKAKDAAMEVEWFSAFKDAIRGHAIIEGIDKYALNYAIETANKKLGM